ncbi:MAG: hypothetical protein ACE5F1_07015 [Planctomycetota bacterium]
MNPGNLFRTIALVAVLLTLTTGGAALAGDDPSIEGDLRTGIQAAMNSYVESQTIDDVVRLYDPVEGRLLRLKFKALHSGIVRKGDFYVSCADFVDQEGREIDVDFLVLPDGATLRATQGVVHAVDGKKRAYHLESK